MNLFIGLCFGMISALALVVMWRMVARLRDERLPREGHPVNDRPAPPGEPLQDAGGES